MFYLQQFVPTWVTECSSIFVFFPICLFDYFYFSSNVYKWRHWISKEISGIIYFFAKLFYAKSTGKSNPPTEFKYHVIDELWLRWNQQNRQQQQHFMFMASEQKQMVSSQFLVFIFMAVRNKEKQLWQMHRRGNSHPFAGFALCQQHHRAKASEIPAFANELNCIRHTAQRKFLSMLARVSELIALFFCP